MSCSASKRRQTQTAGSRRELSKRLYPKRSDRTYWVLTCLRREMERVVDEYVCRCKGARLVDYGCGDMPYRPLFMPYVERYVGCDLPENRLADMRLKDGRWLPIEAAHANIVLSSQVLEHVPSPKEYLAECHRVLADQGLLILTTHGVWKYHPHPRDLWRWTAEGLRSVLQEAGFDLLQLRGILGPASTGIQLWQDATLLRIHRWFKKPFTWVMQSWIRRADLACSNSLRDADASVYFVVARKLTPQDD